MRFPLPKRVREKRPDALKDSCPCRIAPGLALAHARPGPEVLADGFAVATLAEPVAFGHPHNDPVRVVLGLAVTANDRHIGFVAQLANTFNDSDAVERIAEATTADKVRSILSVPPVGAGREPA